MRAPQDMEPVARLACAALVLAACSDTVSPADAGGDRPPADVLPDATPDAPADVAPDAPASPCPAAQPAAVATPFPPRKPAKTVQT